MPSEDTTAPSVSGKRAHEEGLARAVINWLNALHRENGRMQHHRGFDPLAADVLKAARRWRRLQLKPEDVIDVCKHRIAGWRKVSGDWLDNCKPAILFAPQKFDAAMAELRAGFEPGASQRAKPPRDIRFGAVEPSPDTVYAGGEVQL